MVVESEFCEAVTSTGRLRGAVQNGICTFKGVPYGAPTGGGNRFRPPQPVPAWSGVRDALAYGDQCPQQPPLVIPAWSSWTHVTGESENCLVLNVWTPGLRDGGKRPVMVWFHGGGFALLSGSSRVCDGERLAARGDVVVVTLNHRINLFGYLYLAQLGGERYADSGNLGQLDLVAALQWVRDNIEEFGGDPDRVTIFGESGGGGKVCASLAMSAAAGLFHRAIVQSGPFLRAAMPDSGTRFAISMLAALGLGPSEVDALLTLPVAQLIRAMLAVTQGAPIMYFSPFVDERALLRHPFFPDAPAISARVPIMVGHTKDEMTMLFQTPDSFTLSWEQLSAKLQPWMKGEENARRVIELYRHLHPHLSASDLYFEATADRGAGGNSILLAERKVRQQAANVYLYRLEWETPVFGGMLRSGHALDLPLMFDNVPSSSSYIGEGASEAQRVADRMSEAWIAFARNGDPSTPELPWPAYNLQSRPTMIFNVESAVVNDPRSQERQLLASLPEMRPFG